MIYNACVTLGVHLALKNTLGCQGRTIQLCFPLNLISDCLIQSELSYKSILSKLEKRKISLYLIF